MYGPAIASIMFTSFAILFTIGDISTVASLKNATDDESKKSSWVYSLVWEILTIICLVIVIALLIYGMISHFNSS